MDDIFNTDELIVKICSRDDICLVKLADHLFYLCETLLLIEDPLIKKQSKLKLIMHNEYNKPFNYFTFKLDGEHTIDGTIIVSDDYIELIISVDSPKVIMLRMVKYKTCEDDVQQLAIFKNVDKSTHILCEEKYGTDRYYVIDRDAFEFVDVENLSERDNTIAIFNNSVAICVAAILKYLKKGRSNNENT